MPESTTLDIVALVLTPARSGRVSVVAVTHWRRHRTDHAVGAARDRMDSRLVLRGLGEDLAYVGVAAVVAARRSVTRPVDPHRYAAAVQIASHALWGDAWAPGGRTGARRPHRRHVSGRSCIGPWACAHPSADVGSGIRARSDRPSRAGARIGGRTPPVDGSARTAPCPLSIEPIAARTVHGSPGHDPAAAP